MGHSHFLLIIHVVGKSMIVGIRIFSIGEGLGFVSYRNHVSVKWQLE